MAVIQQQPVRSATRWPDGLRTSVTAELMACLEAVRFPDSLKETVVDQLSACGGVLDEGASSLLPLMTALSFESAGECPAVQAAPAAAATAFVMAAADLLDDAQDGDLERNDAEAAAHVGEVVAALIGLGQRALLRMSTPCVTPVRMLRAISAMNEHALHSLAGQHLDVQSGSCESASIKDALAVTVAKAGALGRCAATVGAVLAADDERLIRLHGDFGAELAIVGQLLNDVRGVRPAGSHSTDLKLRRKTPPVAFVYEIPEGVSPPADFARGTLSDRTNPVTEKDQRILRSALLESGALHYAWIVAALRHARARVLAEEIREERENSRIESLLL